MRQIEVIGPAAASPPASEAFERWDVAAIGPGWAPCAGETELWPVEGRLSLHSEGLVFSAEGTVDRASGAPVVAVIPAEAVLDSGPLSPGSLITPSEPAGLWMPRFLRRFRCPGFSVRTREGDWVFDCPHGQQRAGAVSRRYASG
ncbi:MAG TPA: hypothetical protein VK486_06810 [Thermoleophilaceae bacterium]|nr:hypothetical protein [Thermoleophilaceae bacterium]